MENIDWGSLGFGYMKTDYNLRCYYRNGKWEDPFLTDDENISMHMAATCLHYGQEAFEGLKAYRGQDGFIRLFRAEENAKRMIDSANYTKMAAPPLELFVESVKKVVRANEKFVPPYGSGASLYIRPVLIGTGPQVGVKPAEEYLFAVFVMPVGPYFKSGFNPIKVVLERHYDRAAPHGTGHVKVGGNYAASLLSNEANHSKGYANTIYLDAKEKKYVEEFAAANFFGIKNGTYVTPDSKTVLPSITNKCLRQLAEDLGLKVENRTIEAEELPTFEEVGACGTAAVISPVGSIYDPGTDRTITYGDGKTAGQWSKKLYDTLCGIQLGEIEDKHGWTEKL